MATQPELTRPVRVLLADDHDVVRRLLRHSITGLRGLEVIGEAPDGARAVDMAVALEPDIVVLDIAMPVMDGLQAAAAIRRMLPGCRILVFSGFEGDHTAEQALAAGADAYVEKDAGFAAAADAVATLGRGRV
jgi:DNA-binding NarL/FixJ family response regulator